MTATLQTQPPGGGDLAWIRVSVFHLTALPCFGFDTPWTTPITLPAARGSRPFRLVIEEFETFAQDPTGLQQKRLVYADVLSI